MPDPDLPLQRLQCREVQVVAHHQVNRPAADVVHVECCDTVDLAGAIRCIVMNLSDLLWREESMMWCLEVVWRCLTILLCCTAVPT